MFFVAATAGRGDFRHHPARRRRAVSATRVASDVMDNIAAATACPGNIVKYYRELVPGILLNIIGNLSREYC
jgi:hypothetical protein